jgi:hypothetical protein
LPSVTLPNFAPSGLPRGGIELRMFITGRKRLLDILDEFSNSSKMEATFEEAIPGMLQDFVERAKEVTHRGRSGHLAESHIWDYDVHHYRGRVFIDPRVMFSYPRSHVLRLPSIYGLFEHARGGTHAFYQIVIDRYGSAYADVGMKMMMRHWDKSTMYKMYPEEEITQ